MSLESNRLRVQYVWSLLIPFLLLTLPAIATAEYPPNSGEQTPAHQSWSSWGGEITLTFNSSLIRDLGIRITESDTDPDSGTITLTFRPQSSLAFWTLNGGFDGVKTGRLETRSGFTLELSGQSREVRFLQIVPSGSTRTEFEIVDDSGLSLFHLNNTHYRLDRENDQVSFRHMDMRLSDALARLIGVDAYAEVAVGSAEFSTEVSRPPGSEFLKLGGCSSPNWDDGVSFLTDVALINIPKVDQQQLIGSRVFISPDAELQNVGTADVPWHQKFRTPVGSNYPPPYDADQHPYLVWGLYRLQGNNLQQLGASGLKHAFGTVNDVCNCPSGSVLWAPINSPNGMGCTDLYGSATNNSTAHIGIREELDPNTGIWEQCGSIFAPNESPPGPCPQGRASIPFSEIPRRLEVEESDLTTAGARYFLEAWYVIRDDINIFNSMGYLEVFPEKPEQVWIFPDNDDFTTGSLVRYWQDSLLGSPQVSSTDIDNSGGHARLTSHVNALGGGVFEYVYTLVNHDYTAGFTRLSVPMQLPPDADNHTDVDYDATNDWSGTHAAGSFAWDSVLQDNRVRWGTLHRFTVLSTGIPELVTATLSDADSSTYNISVYAPGVPALFADGFED